jgi:hypothetical protein
VEQVLRESGSILVIMARRSNLYFALECGENGMSLLSMNNFGTYEGWT